MIRAVIFDCFGVLVTSGITAFVEHYIPPADAIQAWHIEDALNSGRIDYDTFCLKLGELSGLTAHEVAAQLDRHIPNTQLLDYIRTELKPHYKVSILSNAGDNWLDELIGADNVPLFDDVVLSYAVGYIKPQPEIYRLAAERLGVKLQECVFVDDRERYCAAAKTLGMKTITYQSAPQCIQSLARLLTS